MRIPGIYAEIRGDLTALRKDMSEARQIVTGSAKEISDSLNNALDSNQIKNAINRLINNLGSLHRSAHLTSQNFDNIGVNLREFQKVVGITEAQFASLQSRMMETTAANNQERAFKSLIVSINATESEAKELGAQFGLSEQQIKKVTDSLKAKENRLKSLAGQIKAMPHYKTFAELGVEAISSDAVRNVEEMTKELVNLSQGFNITSKASQLLQIDLDALTSLTGLSSSQIEDLKNRMVNINAEESQRQSLINVANATKLTIDETKALGVQLGLSQEQIDAVTASLKDEENGLGSLANKIKSIPQYTTIAEVGIKTIGDDASKDLDNLAKELVNLSQGFQITSDATEILKIDLDALTNVTNLSSSQIEDLKNRMVSNRAEESQRQSLINVANATKLTIDETKALGAQLGLSQEQIDAVTDSLKANESRLSSVADRIKDIPHYKTIVDVGIEEISDKTLRSVEELAKHFVNLSQGGSAASNASKLLQIDLDALTNTTSLTVEQIEDLKTRMVNINAEESQRQSLIDIANAAKLTIDETRALGIQFGLTENQIDAVTASLKDEENGLNSLASRIGSMPQYKTMAAAGVEEISDRALHSMEEMATNLVDLTRGSEIAGNASRLLRIDLEALTNSTGMAADQIQDLRDQMVRASSNRAQEQALLNIAKAADLSADSVEDLGSRAEMTRDQIIMVQEALVGASDLSNNMTMGEAITQFGIKAFVIIEGLQQSFELINKLFIDFSATLEVANLGIASSYLTGGKFVDKFTGKVLEGQAAFAASQAQARDIIEKLKISNLQTVATLDQLIRVYQETLPIALRVGFNTDQIEQFSLAMIQAAGAIDPTLELMGMLQEETRALLTGTINPRTSRIAVVLGITPADIRRFRHDADGLFNFLMDKLSAYRFAGVELQNTYRGLMSNAKDIYTQVFSMAGKPIFNLLKSELKEAVEYMITLNEQTGKLEWNPAFLENMELIKQGVAILVGQFYRMKGAIDLVGIAAMKVGQVFTTGEWDSKLREVEAMYHDRLVDAEKSYQNLVNPPEVDKSKIETDYVVNPKVINPDDIIKLYKKAYGVIGASTAEVYNFMRQMYERDRDDFIHLTGDKITADKMYKKQMASLGAPKHDYIIAAMKDRVEIINSANKAELKSNKHAYDRGLISHKEYLAEKNRLTEESLKAELALRQEELAKTTVRYSYADKGDFAEMRKIENAQMAVSKAEAALNAARSAGARETIIMNQEVSRSYLQIRQEILNLQNDTVEVARIQAQLDRESVERKRLMADAAADITGAQQALNDVRLSSEIKIKDAELNELERIKLAAVELAELNGQHREAIRLKLELIDIDIARAKLHGLSATELELLKAQRNELEKMSNPMRAFAKGWDDITKQWADSAQLMADAAAKTAKDMQSSFSDFFFDALEGDLKEAGDYFRSFLSAINRQIADMLAKKLVTSAIGGSLSGSLGGLFSIFHDGGVPGKDTVPVKMATIPRYHNGLMSDEFLAILQKGEGVFTKGQMEALGGLITNNTSNTNNNHTAINVPVTIARDDRKNAGMLQREIEETVTRVMRSNI